jgi:hypothetical protein
MLDPAGGGSVLFMAQARNMRCSTLSGTNRKQIELPTTQAIVHGVRDPMEMVMSGYFYHQHTSEKWAVFRSELVMPWVGQEIGADNEPKACGEIQPTFMHACSVCYQA